LRTYTAHHVRYRAGRVQEWAFYAGAIAGLGFMGFAVCGLERYAMATAILGSLAIGVSVGAWVVGARFKD
jgi:hypothetical protein